jgi:hypothetical protein
MSHCRVEKKITIFDEKNDKRCSIAGSDGMFGGIKGRSLKAATPGIPTATIKTFRNMGDEINYNTKKFLRIELAGRWVISQMMIMLMKFLRVGRILVVADLK